MNRSTTKYFELQARTHDRDYVHAKELVCERQYNSGEFRHFVHAQKQLLIKK